jgi:branched-chain amino acid transport system ATP-binding protein
MARMSQPPVPAPAADGQALLHISGLSSGYQRGWLAIRDIDVTLRPGQLVAVLGANGAGKSTLLRTIAGHMRAATGSIVLGGVDVTRTRPARRVRLGISFVPEGRSVFAGMSVEENLRLGCYVRRRNICGKEAAGQIRQVLEIFPALRDKLAQDSASLSGGERAMLTVLRALMAEPRVILLDEPSLGLSPTMRVKLFDTLSQMCREAGTAALIAEQDVGNVTRVSDYVYALRAGEVVMSGPASDFRDRDTLSAIYLARGADEEPAADQAKAK